MAPTGNGTYQPPSNVSDWLSALSAPDPQETPDPEWKTKNQLEIILGLKRAAVLERLRRGLAEGTIEKKVFRTARSDGSILHLPHYRVIK
jgi:hypothetical protein